MHACLGKRDVPVVDVAIEKLQILAAFGERKIVGYALVVMQEILFDGVRAIAQAQNEILVAKMRVVLHNVPQHWPVANRHHWLRDVVRVFPQPHSQSAAKYDDFHVRYSLTLRTADGPSR